MVTSREVSQADWERHNLVTTRCLLRCLLLLFMLTGMAGCKAPPLESTQWELIAMGKTSDLLSPLQETSITLEFDGGDSTLRGSTGCNTYWAEYTADGESLRIANISSTRIWCEPVERMQQEYFYLEALSNAERYELRGDELQIASEVILLIYERI